MKVTLATAADFAMVSADRKLSVIGLFDRITTSAFPTKHPCLYVVLVFRVDKGKEGQKGFVDIKLEDPSGEMLAQASGDMDIPSLTREILDPRDAGGQLGVHMIAQFAGIVFKQPGKHLFRVEVNKESIVDVPVVLQIVPAEAKP